MEYVTPWQEFWGCAGYIILFAIVIFIGASCIRVHAVASHLDIVDKCQDRLADRIEELEDSLEDNDDQKT